MDLVTLQDNTQVQLFAGDFPRVAVPVTIAEGAQRELNKGTVLGKITKAVPEEGTADAGNTGDGTITDVEMGPLAEIGVYRIAFTAATAYQVYAPSGARLPDGGSGEYVSAHIDFTFTAGSEPLVSGDEFTIEVAAGSGKYVEYDKDAVDGSQVARLILAEEVDATEADVKAPAWRTGHFNEAALTGLDAESRAAFEGTPIILGTIV